MMPAIKAQHALFDLKRLKKDGSIMPDYIDCISRSLKSGEIFIMPVDAIYGVVGIKRDDVIEDMKKITGNTIEKMEIIISNFKMLEDMAIVDRSSYSFLKKVWPGEVIVQLKKKRCIHKSSILMRMPRHKFIMDIVNNTGLPLVYMPAKNSQKKALCAEKDIIKKFKNICSILIISEFGKYHSYPTLIDISANNLNIINEGRVSSEEIKSLYFLGDI